MSTRGRDIARGEVIQRSRLGRLLFVGLSLLLSLSVARAEEVADDGEEDMQVVLVTGVHAGPAMWKVSSGIRVLWILGEISPYPRKLKWRSKEFERRLRQSQELIIDFSGYWWIDDDNSAALDKASRIPDGKKLEDIISPELHARVVETAAKFGNPSLEPWRPFSATNRLVSAAMKTLELDGFSVRFAAAKLGEWRKSKVTFFSAPELPFEERLVNWQSPANEVCLKRLVDTIGDGGDGVLQLANAWAVGDIPALRELVPKYSFSRDGFRAGECAAAMHGGEKQADEYKTRRTQAWVAEIERAFKTNRSTIAVVLMSELFEPDGYLAALRAKGYEIAEPK
ncbi:MAG TPA: TraB/GumN family protein [Steroidobacteraceae bacterium]